MKAMESIASLPLLTFSRSLAYTGKSRSTLNRAVLGGTLQVAGRCGGPRGERTFRREDLDRWLVGDVEAAQSSTAAKPPKRRSADVTSALARIRAAASGGSR